MSVRSAAIALPAARASAASDPDWRIALARAAAPLAGFRPDALLLFASHHYAGAFADLLGQAKRVTGAPHAVGCSTVGVIGPAQELEAQPALALLALSLPGGKVAAARISRRMVGHVDHAEWERELGIPASDVDGWIVFADPLRLDGEGLLAGLAAAYPGTVVSGGFAAPGPEDRRAWLFHDGDALTDGAVALAIGGDYALLPVVAQGADPIGEPWTVTGAQSAWIETIGHRPALDVLNETLRALPEELRPRARLNLLVGLAAGEYRHRFQRGDFLVRNLAGIDQASGAIAVGAGVRAGQTIQFQMRDAATADLDLTAMLDGARQALRGRRPIAGLLAACNGRGTGLFGTPHHDAAAIARKFPGLPLAGCFCAGEIGPVDGVNQIHGFTASLALIVRRD